MPRSTTVERQDHERQQDVDHPDVDAERALYTSRHRLRGSPRAPGGAWFTTPFRWRSTSQVKLRPRMLIQKGVIASDEQEPRPGARGRGDRVGHRVAQDQAGQRHRHAARECVQSAAR